MNKVQHPREEDCKFYYDDPWDALYMNRTFDVELIKFPTPEQIEEYGCTRPWNWVETCCELGGPEVHMIDDAIQYIDEAFGRVYVSPLHNHIFKPREYDLVNCLQLPQFMRCQTVFSDPSNEDALYVKDFYMGELINMPITSINFNGFVGAIIQRESRNFIFPEVAKYAE